MRYIYLAIFGLILFNSCDTEDNLEPSFEKYFLKYYGEEGNQEGIDIVALSDGGFAVLGRSNATGANSQIYVTRTDSEGNEIWSNTYGGGLNEEPTDMEADANENLLISANLEETSGGSTDVLFLRIDLEGNRLDSAVFGLPGISERVNSITIVSDGNVIGIGSTTNVDQLKPNYDPLTDLQDFYSIRLTNSLVDLEPFQWKQVVGYPGIDIGQKIIERSNGTFIIYGTTDDPNSNPQQAGFNLVIFPTNELGDIGSSFEVQYYGTLANETAAQIVETIDGGFSMIGTSVQEGSHSMFAARVRNNINFVNSSSIDLPGSIEGVSISPSASGGFFLLGTSNPSANGNIVLVKTSDSGGIEWSREFGGIDNDSAAKVIQLEDGSLLLLGTIELESQRKISLIKINRFGEFNSN